MHWYRLIGQKVVLKIWQFFQKIQLLNICSVLISTAHHFLQNMKTSVHEEFSILQTDVFIFSETFMQKILLRGYQLASFNTHKMYQDVQEKFWIPRLMNGQNVHFPSLYVNLLCAECLPSIPLIDPITPEVTIHRFCLHFRNGTCMDSSLVLFYAMDLCMTGWICTWKKIHKRLVVQSIICCMKSTEELIFGFIWIAKEIVPRVILLLQKITSYMSRCRESHTTKMLSFFKKKNEMEISKWHNLINLIKNYH